VDHPEQVVVELELLSEGGELGELDASLLLAPLEQGLHLRC
jgi:hypothetical protein